MVGVTILIGGEARGVRVTQLTTGTGTPGVEVTVGEDCYCMSLATGDLSHFLLLEDYYEFRLGLIGTAILILRHSTSIRVSELSAATSTPRVQPALLCKCDSMRIPTSYHDHPNIKQQFNNARSGLVRITFNISGQVLHGRESELTAGTGTPGVYIALDVH